MSDRSPKCAMCGGMNAAYGSRFCGACLRMMDKLKAQDREAGE